MVFAETCFVRFTSMYLFYSILGCSANGIAFKIYISIHLLLAYRNIIGFCMFIFHFVTFLSLEFLEDFIFCLFFRFLGIFCVKRVFFFFPNLLLLLFSRPVVSDSLWPYGLQYFRPPCPSLSPGVCPSSCPQHQWCRPAISSSDTFFSLCPQSFSEIY